MSENLREYKKGAIILRENVLPTEAFLVIRGQVGMYLRSEEYQKIIPLGVVKAGELLGEMNIVASLPRTVECIALGDVTLRPIDLLSLKSEMEKMPGWIRSMVNSLAERAFHIDNLLRSASAVDKDLLNQLESMIFSSDPSKKKVAV